jgi:hypothetical protein
MTTIEEQSSTAGDGVDDTTVREKKIITLGYFVQIWRRRAELLVLDEQRMSSDHPIVAAPSPLSSRCDPEWVRHQTNPLSIVSIDLFILDFCTDLHRFGTCS